jgi:isoquinoline 1-oxidoreductase beta subunit
MEAARLSQAVGQPVHVGWTRAEEMQLGFFRPPTHSALSARLENGRIVALRHEQASGEVAFPFLPGFLQTVFGSDFGAWRGARIVYRGIPNLEATAKAVALPVRTGWWRGLGLLANIFAIESFMDELAAAAGADPLQFRLDHLGGDEDNQRLARLLQAVAERAGWSSSPPAGRARGIACSADYGTMAAMVAEVSLDDSSGEIRVHRATIGIDPGLIINPDGAIAQTQGCVVMGLSSTLIEEMTVADSAVTALNFDRYPLLTLDRVPEIEVLLQSSGDVPHGLGEPPMGPVAAAVANAVHALTGLRLRQLPFTPERVLAAADHRKGVAQSA